MAKARAARGLWRDRLIAWGRRLAVLGVLAMAGSIAEVLAVRWIDPPGTLTMVDRVFDRGRAGQGWAWVDYRPRPLAELGEPAARAAVASEDGLFWVHRGFDWGAVCGAFASNRAGGRLRGGSTISQQVARNVFLWQRRSWLRKGLEVWYTAWLELLVPKERILELYLNVAETGPHTFGMEAAAWRWYGRPALQLSREQAARIIGLLPNPRGRVPDGDDASRRVVFVRDNAVPFPGERGFDAAHAVWAATPWPWECLFGRR